MLSAKPEWKQLLGNAVANTSTRQVAKEIGYSAATVSLVLADKYPGNTAKVASKVMARYSRVHCPYDDKEIAKSRCGDLATARAPSHNPIKMAHWRACQRCHHNPKNGVSHD